MGRVVRVSSCPGSSCPGSSCPGVGLSGGRVVRECVIAAGALSVENCESWPFIDQFGRRFGIEHSDFQHQVYGFIDTESLVELSLPVCEHNGLRNVACVFITHAGCDGDSSQGKLQEGGFYPPRLLHVGLLL